MGSNVITVTKLRNFVTIVIRNLYFSYFGKNVITNCTKITLYCNL